MWWILQSLAGQTQPGHDPDNCSTSVNHGGHSHPPGGSWAQTHPGDHVPKHHLGQQAHYWPVSSVLPCFLGKNKTKFRPLPGYPGREKSCVSARIGIFRLLKKWQQEATSGGTSGCKAVRPEFVSSSQKQPTGRGEDSACRSSA